MNLKQRIKKPKFDDETFLTIIVAISAIMFLTMGFMLYLDRAGITQDMSIKQAANKFDQSITRTYEDLKQASEDSPIRL